jgi:hypothetical protein
MGHPWHVEITHRIIDLVTGPITSLTGPAPGTRMTKTSTTSSKAVGPSLPEFYGK